MKSFHTSNHPSTEQLVCSRCKFRIRANDPICRTCGFLFNAKQNVRVNNSENQSGIKPDTGYVFAANTALKAKTSG